MQLRGTGSLVIAGLLDFFTFALCLPYSETSEGASFETLLTMVASRGRAIFRLFSVHLSVYPLRVRGHLCWLMLLKSSSEAQTASYLLTFLHILCLSVALAVAMHR